LGATRATTAAFFSSRAMGTIAPDRLFDATMLSAVFRGRAVFVPCRSYQASWKVCEADAGGYARTGAKHRWSYVFWTS